VPARLVPNGLGYRSAVPDRIDLLVLGDVNPDLILTGNVEPAFGQAESLVDEARITIGGSGAIAACAAARLGLRVALCGVVGDDLFGRFMRDELERRGVDVGGLVVDEAEPTGSTVVLARRDDRAILTHTGAIGASSAERIDQRLLAGARHVHVSSYFLQERLAPALPAVFDTVRAAGGTTSIDPNWDPAQRWDGGLLEVLDRTDVFLPNDAEAIKVAGGTDLDDAVATLAGRAALVVVKTGREGAVAAAGGRRVRTRALAVDAVDTTGAGDTFDAGFLASRLAGDELERSLAIANACGALSTRGLGVEAQPTMQEVLQLLQAG
jgi:sugar/nucleoside kinase (ribokinase family)